MNLEPGTKISHYKILSKIGKGGMGEVYLAEDTKLDRKVAIKFLSDEFSKDTDKLNRFVQEAKAASALNHPNILTIHEIGEIDGTNYIATEFIDGKDLSHFISENKVSLESALDISIQIVSALKTAHEAGIVHRDIKPDNAMIRKDGIVKLLDFGLAKLSEKPSDETPDLEAATIAKINTIPGVVMGTPNYMSPEQARGKDIDHQTDIFSFGIVLYEMLTRKLPFAGGTTSDIIASILTKEPTLIEEFNETVPDDLKTIVARSLKKNKSERYQNASELLEDLKALKKRVELDEELERTILPEGQETKVFQATTAAEVQNTTANDSRVSVSIEKSSVNKLLLALAGIVLISTFGVGYWFYSAGDSDQIESIAVMPFVNESGNEDVEYLSDGMTESLINSLSNIPNLSVKARSTVFFYKGKKISAKNLGEELNVQAVLLGRFTQRGEDIKISLELVDTKTQDVLWGEQFDRKLNALVSLQSEIAKRVAGKITSKLSGEEEKKVTKSYTENPEAYQAYLKGRFYWNQRTEQGFNKGIEYFRQAIDIDPNYALAWSGMADSYFLLPEYGDYSPKEYFLKAKTAAVKAIEIDPDLAEAQTSLAYIEHSFEWKFAAAEKRYKKAIELNPNYATAYQWYGEFLVHQRRFDEAQRVAKKAVDLDPLALIKNTGLGQAYIFAREYAKAEAQYRKTLEIKPEFAVANRQLARSVAAQGRTEEALSECDKSIKSGGDNFKYCRGMIYASAGDRKNAYRYISEYTGLASRQVYDVAIIHAFLGDDLKAFEGVEKLFEEKSVFILYLNAEPAFDKYRKNPGFMDIMKRVGFEK